VPYYFIGAKAYDFLAGSKNLTGSYYMNKNQALMQFPMLKSQGLVGAIVYYDGVHNDSRMNVAVAMTAIQHGACVANHVKVESLIKENDRVCGANVRDQLTGDCWPVYSKVVINATGPFCDSIRKMDDPNVKEIVSPSAGVHLILPNYFSPRNMGLIDPYTSDGRVIFFLPWQGSTIVGTTDSPTSVTANPIPQDQDINWILKQVANYLSPDLQLRRGDVLAAWSGIRPLVSDPDAKNTSQLVRNHMINISESGLLTIAGGKWTTYRKMAEDTINLAIERFDLKPLHPCNTADIKLVGSQSWTKNTFIKLIQHFGFETEVAQHLSDSYGDRSWAVAAVAKETGGEWPVYGRRVIPGYPYIEAEIRYSCHQEYACTVVVLNIK
jgi:glycerol-3-phosphate dehydrogenase